MKSKDFDEKNYEIPDEIDFSDGIRGKFYQPKKIPTSMRLDDDIIKYFKLASIDKKQGYQTLINTALREYISKHPY